MSRSTMDVPGNAERLRRVLLLGFGIFFGALYVLPILDLLSYILHPMNRRYNSHIVLIPLVSGYLLLTKRKEISGSASFSPFAGVPLLGAGVGLHLLGGAENFGTGPQDPISLRMFSAVVFLVGGFLSLYGTKAFQSARFPLLFLLFVVPMPAGMMERFLQVLKVCSTEVSYGLFKLLGVAIFRQGFVFSLPGATIEVAENCSGLRASLTLFVVTVLAGHLFLKSYWRRALLVFSTFPITIFGNSVRIVGLTLLALQVDMAFLEGESLAHLRGGWFFFLVDLAIAGGVLALLIRQEKSTVAGSSTPRIAQPVSKP